VAKFSAPILATGSGQSSHQMPRHLQAQNVDVNDVLMLFLCLIQPADERRCPEGVATSGISSVNVVAFIDNDTQWRLSGYFVLQLVVYR